VQLPGHYYVRKLEIKYPEFVNAISDTFESYTYVVLAFPVPHLVQQKALICVSE